MDDRLQWEASGDRVQPVRIGDVALDDLSTVDCRRRPVDCNDFVAPILKPLTYCVADQPDAARYQNVLAHP